MISRYILHLDMDAFFAAIEQLDHPEFRGKPVVVGADPKKGQGRGVVSTCSYEARKYGIHSAMPISRAYKCCPHAIYVHPRGQRYAEVSRQVMAILQHYSPDVEPLSIDEAFLDITSTYKIFGSPEKLAQNLKARIRKDTHLTASVGIAPNKFIAKIASDLDKPDGLVIVQHDEVQHFLHPLNISRLWGVGQKTLPVLQKLGIQTIGDLAGFSKEMLIRQFGKMGEHLYNLSHGIDDRPVSMEHERKSISKEITFDKDVNDAQELRQTLFYICNELAHEMRRKDIRGRTITMKIRLENFTTFTRSLTLASPVNHCDTIFKHVFELFSQFKRSGSKVRLLGVGMSNLEHRKGQLDLFDSENKDSRVDEVMDQIRTKYGNKSITRASLIGHRRDSQWIRE